MIDEAQAAASADLPIGLVMGAQNRFLRVEYRERVALKQPWRGGAIVLDGVGHCPHLEAPAALAEIVGAFVDDVLVAPTR